MYEILIIRQKCEEIHIRRAFCDYKIVIHVNEVHVNVTRALEQFLCLFTKSTQFRQQHKQF